MLVYTLKSKIFYRVVDFHSLLDKCFSPSSSTNGTVRGYYFHPLSKSNTHLFQSETYYLRAIGENQRKDVALLSNDFPSIADDLEIPKIFPADKLFSSVLRISSNRAQLWTHYDVF